MKKFKSFNALIKHGRFSGHLYQYSLFDNRIEGYVLRKGRTGFVLLYMVHNYLNVPLKEQQLDGHLQQG